MCYKSCYIAQKCQCLPFEVINTKDAQYNSMLVVNYVSTFERYSSVLAVNLHIHIILYTVGTRSKALHGFVDVTFHVTLNGRDDLCYFASLVGTEAKVFDDGYGFARETQG